MVGRPGNAKEGGEGEVRGRKGRGGDERGS